MQREDMNDLFDMFVDQDELGSDGLDALYDIPARAHVQDENAGGQTPESTPGLSAVPPTAAQTPGDEDDADGGDNSVSSPGGVQDSAAGAAADQEDRAKVWFRRSCSQATSDVVCNA
ncbi:hypothetical protein AURDEDRAFT_112816 [Auricularia subglabra TFB-10046 SS5]|nr:hypothetical protein AURDEDRAFT_112816 [Auricularia subglabra TFB-10046 SS5]